jgi:hypothetical protein
MSVSEVIITLILATFVSTGALLAHLITGGTLPF